MVFDSEALRQAQDEDPLVAAGWEGVLFLSFLAVLILSALGFLVASFLTAQTRSLEFAILRTSSSIAQGLNSGTSLAAVAKATRFREV